MYRVPDQTGRTIVVTGASGGIGKEAATRLAGAGAHVILAVRNPEKGEQALTDIRAEHHDARVEMRLIDTADLASVRRFAAEIDDNYDHIDALVNNAGVMAPPKWMVTVDGFEMQMGTNFLGPFALTNLLLPALLRSEAPRVSTMSSVAAWMGVMRFDDLDSVGHYIPMVAYGQTKLADYYLASHLAETSRRLGWRLISNAAHPGLSNTNITRTGRYLGKSMPNKSYMGNVPFLPIQEADRGAEPMLFAVADPAAENGGYYGPNGKLELTGIVSPARVTKRMADSDAAARLWAVAEKLTGTALPQPTPAS